MSCRSACTRARVAPGSYDAEHYGRAREGAASGVAEAGFRRPSGGGEAFFGFADPRGEPSAKSTQSQSRPK
jgi:hypothetical protein